MPYVDNLLKLENSSTGRVVGNVILRVVMERLRDLDVSGQNLLHEQLFSPSIIREFDFSFAVPSAVSKSN